MKKLLKGFIVILLLLVLNFSFMTVPVSAMSLASVTFNDVSARKGDVVEITVTLADAPKVKSMAVAPIYDSERLEYVSGEWLIGGALLSDWDQTEQNGVLLYSSETNVNGDIAKFSFRIKEHTAWTDIVFSARVILKDASGSVNVTVQPLSIFLICDHIWDEIVHTQAATCEQAGYTYWLCTICQRENKLIDILKVAHSPSEWIVDKEATILEEGSRYKNCTVCGEVLEKEVLPLLGQCNHEWSDEVYLEEATCVQNGSVYKVCEICTGKSKVYEIAKLPHIPGEWLIDKEATANETGIRHKECTVCEALLVEETIPALGECSHSWGNEVFMEKATCLKAGYVYGICGLCGEQGKLYDIAKMEHTPSEWIVDKEATVNETGIRHKECTVCKEVLEQSVIPKLEETLSKKNAILLAVGCGVGGIILGGAVVLIIRVKKETKISENVSEVNPKF